MKTNLFYHILLLGIATFFVIISCRKEDLDTKSFPIIDNLNAVSLSKTEEIITFNISGEVETDQIVAKEIYYAPSEQVPPPQFEFPPNSNRSFNVEDNFVQLDKLEPGTWYSYKIVVRTKGVKFDQATSSEDPKTIFESRVDSFLTPRITLVLDTIITFEKQLKFEAFGIFEDFKREKDLINIIYIGHIWKKDGREIARTFSNKTKGKFTIEEISQGGSFTSNLHFVDPTVSYSVSAFVQFENPSTGNIELIESTAKTYSFSEVSKGDFWINLADIKGVDDQNNEVDNGHDQLPELEGAVSFVLGNFAYVGLGRQPDGLYNKNFYKYDPSKNTWEESVSFPFTSRMFAVSYEDNSSGNAKAYIGTGCNPCEGDALVGSDTSKIVEHRDFYSFDGNTWRHEFDIDRGRFGAYAFANNGQTYVGGGISKSIQEGDANNNGVIDEGEWHDLNGDGIVSKSEWDPVSLSWNDLNNDSKITAGEWQDENNDQRLTIGEWQDNGDALFNSGEWVDNGDGTFDSGEWVDANNNNTFETGEWIDDGDLIYETGEWIDDGNGLFETGEWIDDGDTVFIKGEWMNTNNDKDFDPGEWQDDGDNNLELREDWIWKDINPQDNRLNIFQELFNATNNMLWVKDINSSFFSGEWVDRNHSGQIDLGDECFQCFTDANDNIIDDSSRLDFSLEVRNDFGTFDNIRAGSVTRYGARIIHLSNTVLLVGGDRLPNAPQGTAGTICEFNSSDWDCPPTALSPARDIDTRVYPFAFTIGTEGYFGGGEYSGNRSVNFDLWHIHDSEITQATGCGLSNLTRGISFAFQGKGYIGFGKTNDQVSKEFWVYIPCLKPPCN